MRAALLAAACVTSLLGWLELATAHHSPAVFDRSRELRVEGVVKEFKWGMPHSWIQLDVTEENGAVATWGIEMNPASTLVKRGWRASTLKPGDKVSVLVYPLRNDEKGGQYISITLPDGKVLTERDDGVI
jgi:hypothetical protein